MVKLINWIEKQDNVDYVYGSECKQTMELTMAGGGSHWWSYIIYFDNNGEQQNVEIWNTNGKKWMDGKLYIFHPESNGEYVMLLTDFEYEKLPKNIQEEAILLVN